MSNPVQKQRPSLCKLSRLLLRSPVDMDRIAQDDSSQHATRAADPRGRVDLLDRTRALLIMRVRLRRARSKRGASEELEQHRGRGPFFTRAAVSPIPQLARFDCKH